MEGKEGDGKESGMKSGKKNGGKKNKWEEKRLTGRNEVNTIKTIDYMGGYIQWANGIGTTHFPWGVRHW